MLALNLNSSLLPTCADTLIHLFAFSQKVSAGDILLARHKDIKTLCSSHEMVCALPPFSHMLGLLDSGTFWTPSPSQGLQGTEMWHLLLQDNVWRPMLSLPGVIYANWPTQSTASSFSKKLTSIAGEGVKPCGGGLTGPALRESSLGTTLWRSKSLCTPLAREHYDYVFTTFRSTKLRKCTWSHRGLGYGSKA